MSAAIAGIAIGGATFLSNMSKANAAEDAANAQINAAERGIGVSNERFKKIEDLLQPYLTQGAAAVQQQGNILGLGAPGSEQAFIDSIRNGSTFQALSQSGVDAILQNASATGGLRGGNVQGALAQFQPQLLSSLINQRFNQLGGLSTLGQNSAVNLGNFATSSGKDIASLLEQEGAAQAGGNLAQGQFAASIPSAIASGLGMFKGLGGKF